MKSKKHEQLRKTQSLNLPVRRLKGVGPKRAVLLAQKGLHTVLDLFLFMPIRYEDRTKVIPMNKACEGTPVLVKGMIVYGKEESFYPSRKRVFRIIIEDEFNSLELIWFQYRKPHLISFAKVGTELLAYGSIRVNRGQRQMVHPDVTVIDSKEVNKHLGFYPVYSTVPGISGNFMRYLIRSSLESYLETIVDPIPMNITSSLDLPSLSNALSYVHFPSEDSSIDQLLTHTTPFHKRLMFDQFILILLAIFYRKRKREMVKVQVLTVPENLPRKIRDFFQFSLTSHQLAAIEDVVRDFQQESPMSRLLMGDVGCGKTIVAVIAIYITLLNGKQAAMMVPTQILAEQHFQYISTLPKVMGFRPVLITGKLPISDRKKQYKQISSGSYNVIIGTHVIIQEDLSFSDLGLAVIDEQHRFGVRQRALIEKKGKTPHLLVMTATPIPRTLAITAYGDLDISIINEYPKGHTPVETHLVDSDKKRWVFETLKKGLRNGDQAFVICPIIGSTEDYDLKSAQEMERSLRKILSPSFQVGLIHGQLSPDERIKRMSDFRDGLTHLLVGTTVIEVGVHVPNATIMIIEHPERFGLAQLHQLRGRIGRGRKQGICILMKPENLSDKGLARLETFVNESDGFEIAGRDLELRGHGELTGIRQSGIGELDFADLVRVPDLFIDAKREAYNLIASDPDLRFPEHAHLKAMIDSIKGTTEE